MKTNKITVKKTGAIVPSTDLPNCPEWAVILNGEIIDYVAASTMSFALELAKDIVRERSDT